MSRSVFIRQARRAVEVPDGGLILDSALEAGVPYPHGCRSGRCGSCKSRLVEGEVQMLPHTRFALTDAEKADGLILACRAQPLIDCTVAWLGEVEETADHPLRRLSARIASVEDATHDIKRIRLALDEPFEYSAGQYARLTFPGAPARDYSMAGPPGGPELEFHVRRVPGGAASERIFAEARAGVPVEVSGPYGSSFLRRFHAGPVLAVAGGSGLAPIKAIVETALASGMRQPIHVYFGARTHRDVYLLDHFQGLADRHDNLSFQVVLSEAADPRPFRGGYVGDAVAQDLPDLDGWKAYLAGPPAMFDATAPVLLQRGLRIDDLHADVFFTPETAEDPSRPTVAVGA